MKIIEERRKMSEMLEKNSFFEKFKILSDEPLFKKRYQAKKDAFHHEAYANTIYKLLLNNNPPLTIGLFGSWGIGKSTVINILLNKIKEERSHNLIPVYFNAWKYSGDSFRREFLLATVSEIFKDREEERSKIMEEIKTLYHRPIIKDILENKNIIVRLKEIFKSMRWNIKTTVLLLVTLFFAAIIGIVVWIITHNVLSSLGTALLGAFAHYLTQQIPNIIEFRQTEVIDPKLVLPEQFEEKFKDILDPEKYNYLEGKNILIIIDDFDRCHPRMIYDILTSVKTFLKHDRCFFLIALDDKSVVKILRKENRQYGYEELRKYFDVTVRMSPIGESDLVDFANAVARETGIPENIIQIAILAGCNDARKMKHFINTFTVKYRIAKEREAAGFIPFSIDNQLDTLAKMVVIETQYPRIFDQILKKPQFFEELEKQALRSNPSNNEEIKKCFEDYPSLKKFLENTRDIRVRNLELFSMLKISNIEARLPRGTELKNAIISNQKDTIKGILKGIKSNESKTALVDLVVDMLNRANAIFLQNTTEFVLDVINLENFLTDSNKNKLSRAVCKNFFKPTEKQRILNQNINYFFKCADIAGSYSLHELTQNLIEEINKEEEMPDCINDIIDNLYKFKLLIGQPAWVTTINKKLDEWYDKACKEHKELEYLQIVSNLYISDEEEIRKGQPFIPSIETLKKIAKNISTNKDKGIIKLNELKRKILFDRWDDALIETVSERTQAIFAQYQNETTFSGPIKFAVETVIDIPNRLPEKYVSQIATSAQNFYK